MKKLLFTLMIIALFTCPVMAQRYRQFQVAFTDEFGVAVTNITQINIYNSGTTTATTIYQNRAGGTMTNPITAASAGSRFDAATGTVTWFQRAASYKMTVTDGTKVLTIDTRNEGDTRFPWFANYIGTAASLSVNDNQTITVGTDSDAVLNWVNSTSILQWIPAADGVSFNIGSTAAATQWDFNVYVLGIAGGGLSINEGTGAFNYTSTSGAISFDKTGTGTFKVHEGAATGAIAIGSGTSGAWSLDGTSTGGLTADGQISITTTDSLADIVLDASGGGRILLTGTENAADAIIATVDGGTTSTIKLFNDTGNAATKFAASIQLTSDLGGIQLISGSSTATTELASAIQLTARTGSIELNSGLNGADAINIMVDGSTSSGILVFNDTGTGDESIALKSDVGGITFNAAAGSIDIEAVGASAGDLGLVVGDDMTTTVTGNMYTTVTASATISAGSISLNSTGGHLDLIAAGATLGDMDITVGDDMTTTVTGISYTTITGSWTLQAGTTTLDDFNFTRRVIRSAATCTLYAYNSGGVFVNTADTYQVYELPTAVVGLQYTFLDMSSANGDEIKITAAASDNINGGTANKSIRTSGDQRNSITLIAGSITSWQIVSGTGTWVHTDP